MIMTWSSSDSETCTHWSNINIKKGPYNEPFLFLLQNIVISTTRTVEGKKSDTCPIPPYHLSHPYLLLPSFALPSFPCPLPSSPPPCHLPSALTFSHSPSPSPTLPPGRWRSWLSHLSNTQKVLSSNLGRLIFLTHFVREMNSFRSGDEDMGRLTLVAPGRLIFVRAWAELTEPT